LPIIKAIPKEIEILKEENTRLSARVHSLDTQLQNLMLEKYSLAAQVKQLESEGLRRVVYAKPREVTSIDDCYFYHVMDIPGYGTTTGEWDLRGREAEYLGNVSFKGKRVLEIGTASGHLCFYMERMGADVVAFDLSEEQTWDMVPYADYDYGKAIKTRKEQIRRINNAFWLAHKAFNSKADVMYGTIYNIPPNLGKFDVCTFCSILLHLPEPFLALHRALRNVTETVIITDLPIDTPGKENSCLI
jgi:SAM-dependent methyltransferase